MNDVSLLRLYLLRAMYLLIVVGLGAVVWPDVLARSRPWELNQGVVASMLAAFSLMCLLGLRYPLQMLPVLFWEMAWKLLWLFNEALPRWLDGSINERIVATAFDCSVVILVPLVIPWSYVYARFVSQPGDRWRPVQKY